MGLVLPLILAEQITWDNDNDILIIDSWDDINGVPLDGAICSWQLYNPELTLNQSGVPSLSNGVMNFTISRLSTIQIYPLLINCTKNNFNGTSSKDSIKIVDELTEDFKDQIDKINETTQQINITTREINITTHMTYDLLSTTINDTLNSILSITNFTKNNLTDINNQLSNILENTEILKDKWGDEDAGELENKIKDLKKLIQNLEFRIDFISDSDISQRTLSILTSARKTNDLLQGDKEFWEKFRGLIIPIIIGLTIFILVIILINSIQKKKMNFELPRN